MVGYYIFMELMLLPIGSLEMNFLKTVSRGHFTFSMSNILRRYFLGACPGPDPGISRWTISCWNATDQCHPVVLNMMRLILS
jgi:hypothetical protein